MSTIFKGLLEMATSQEQPQRLLFLFAQPEIPDPKKSNSGHIKPVMCVDKLPNELTTFGQLIKEADLISKDWSFAIISGMSGQNGVAPTTEDAEQFLNKMSNDLVGGQDLGRYLILDREENKIEMERS